MKVINLTPRGYCHGVLRALKIVKKVVEDKNYPRPIYVLGQIVHNKSITKAFFELGVISLDQAGKTRLELLDKIDKGTVIFTAHGISKKVIERTKEKGLAFVNASCKDVIKVHQAIEEKIAQNFEIIYIGHRNHPEPEAVLAIDDKIYFVENEKDALLLPQHLSKKDVFVTNQTTLSTYDIEAVLNIIKLKIPNFLFDNEICNATLVRQQAVLQQEPVDLMIVVGDKLSSNSNKLAYVGRNGAKIKSYLVESINDINLNWLLDIDSVSITSGASTPTAITQEITTFLSNYDKSDPSTWSRKSKLTNLDIL